MAGLKPLGMGGVGSTNKGTVVGRGPARPVKIGTPMPRLGKAPSMKGSYTAPKSGSMIPGKPGKSGKF